MMINWTRLPLFILLSASLSACGGGSSNSGGGPPPIVVQSGFYEGTQTLTFSTATNPGEAETTPFELSVSGVAPSQQVLLRYREFSGTSSIGPNQEFRIPSGRFPIDSGADDLSCTIALVFEGRFVGTTANGTITGDIVCEPGNFVIDVNGTFTVSLALSKLDLNATSLPDLELGNVF